MPLSYFEHFSKHFVYSGHNSLKAFLEVIKENLLSKLESSFDSKVVLRYQIGRFFAVF